MNKKLSWVVNNLKEENSIEELATFKNLFDNNKFKSVAEAAKMASILYKENHSDNDNKKSTIFINGNWDKDIRKKKQNLIISKPKF